MVYITLLLCCLVLWLGIMLIYAYGEIQGSYEYADKCEAKLLNLKQKIRRLNNEY